MLLVGDTTSHSGRDVQEALCPQGLQCQRRPPSQPRDGAGRGRVNVL